MKLSSLLSIPNEILIIYDQTGGTSYYISYLKVKNDLINDLNTIFHLCKIILH